MRDKKNRNIEVFSFLFSSFKSHLQKPNSPVTFVPSTTKLLHHFLQLNSSLYLLPVSSHQSSISQQVSPCQPSFEERMVKRNPHGQNYYHASTPSRYYSGITPSRIDDFARKCGAKKTWLPRMPSSGMANTGMDQSQRRPGAGTSSRNSPVPHNLISCLGPHWIRSL
jgi:hypothetical protein